MRVEVGGAGVRRVMVGGIGVGGLGGLGGSGELESGEVVGGVWVIMGGG